MYLNIFIDFLIINTFIKPASRLGYYGPQEVKQHLFFTEIDWELLYQKKIEPPFKPKLSDERDLRHFDKVIKFNKLNKILLKK